MILHKKETSPTSSLVDMPLTVVCHSCGFVLYSGREPKSVDDILRKWGYRCPCCLSPLKPKIQGYKIEVTEHDSESESELSQSQTTDIDNSTGE